MGLLDKVKAQAATATSMAKDAAQKGQAKLDEVQSKRGADGILRDLGAAVYATKTGRATPTTDADIDRLVAALQAHESEHGALTLAPESAAAAPTATTFAPPTAAAPGSTPPSNPTAAADAGSPAPSASPPPPPAATTDPLSPPPPPPTAQTL
jgi:molecular chaperone DnaK